MRYIYIIYFLFLFGFNIPMVTGQNLLNCSQTLRLAQEEFDHGHFQAIPSLLLNCLSGTGIQYLEGQERIDAYRLLILVYLFSHEPEKADQMTLQMLRYDPYFEVNKDIDPAELVALYNTFRTQPIIRVGAKIGTSMTMPASMNLYPLYASTVKYRVPSMGFVAGVSAEIPLSDKITINPDILYTQRRLSFSLDRFSRNQPDPYATTDGVRNESILSIPVMTQYSFFDRKNIFYGGLGAEMNYVLSGKINDLQLLRSNFPSVSQKDETLIINNKHRVRANIIGAVGAKIPFGKGYFVAELRMYYGLNRVNALGSIYGDQNSTLMWDYGYIDGVFKQHGAMITVSYIYNVFRPKKLSQKKNE